jgi:chemotaxis protein MotB
VFLKNGLVYVELADQLLYKSGSAKLSDSGKRALGSLAGALNDYPRLKVIVMGNTDDVQFAKGSGDNWSLSTERANGVVRTLRDDFQVEGKYNPVDDNMSKEGRAKNRRTDIILNPDLERIWQEVQQDHQ